MKALVLGATAFFVSSTYSQVFTTVANGDFFSPATWDCTCFPADGDSLVINHAVTMSFGIPYTSGQILINSAGSLTNSTDLDIYINGGSLINHGLVDVGDFLLDSGFVINTGTMDLDSLLTRDQTDNSGTITAYDFAHDQYATFTNDGDIMVNNNFNNEGDFYLNGDLMILNDASNCNIQTSNAMMQIEGIMCVSNDFANCGTDTLRSSGSGEIYIGGVSSNAGEVEGTLTVNDPGIGFDVNIGTIAGTVVEGSALCGVGVDEADIASWIVYPNPATSHITSSLENVNYSVYDFSGKLMATSFTPSGLIDIGHLPDGIYAVQLIDQNGASLTEVIRKK